MPVYRVRNRFGKRTLHEFQGGLFGKEVQLEDLPETVWVAFLGNRPKQWRLEVMKRSSAILRLPNSAEIHSSEASARGALVKKIKSEIEAEQRISENAIRNKQALEKILLAVNMGGQ